MTTKTLLAILLASLASYSHAEANVTNYSVKLYNFMHYCDIHDGRVSLVDNVMACKDGAKIVWTN